MDAGDLVDEKEPPGAEFDVNTSNDIDESEKKANEVGEENKTEKKGENDNSAVLENKDIDKSFENDGTNKSVGNDTDKTEQNELVGGHQAAEGEQDDEPKLNDTIGEQIKEEHVEKEDKEGESEGEKGEEVKTENKEDEQDSGIEQDKQIDGENVEDEHAAGEDVDGEHLKSDAAEAEHIDGEQIEGEHTEGEHLEGEHIEGEHAECEYIEGEHAEGEHIEGEHAVGDHVDEEQVKIEGAEGENVEGEVTEGEYLEGEEKVGEETQPVEEEKLGEEVAEEDEYYEPPADPAAPYELSDSKEALRPPYVLRPDQIAELETLWQLYQDYTPAYSNIDNYITAKELIYMLKCLNLMTHTAEQLQELIDFCVRPPNSMGHISYDQFTHMVKIRLRDISAEEELRFALQVMDPDGTGILDREFLKEVLSTKGNRMGPKALDNLIKEVDISQDGTIGIEDVVGTMAIDLNTEDLEMLRAAVYPPEKMLGHENDSDNK